MKEVNNMNIYYNEETKEYYTETGEILEDMTEEEYEEQVDILADYEDEYSSFKVV